VLIYLEKKSIKRKNMQHLIKSLIIITRANIIKLISKKLNNILRNRISNMITKETSTITIARSKNRNTIIEKRLNFLIKNILEKCNILV